MIGHQGVNPVDPTLLGICVAEVTGLAFNSVVALELHDGSPMNPMADAGAVATTALIPASRLPNHRRDEIPDPSIEQRSQS
ncbi:glutaminase [Rhodococcus jostii]|jgi:glutaminase|uniref:glutaminase n=1 Tax=Rhodococcus jostii TaxID=132919 RepID=UPI00031B5FB8|nr:glutaminase [Rhodococcus jostii]